MRLEREHELYRLWPISLDHLVESHGALVLVVQEVKENDEAKVKSSCIYPIESFIHGNSIP